MSSAGSLVAWNVSDPTLQSFMTSVIRPPQTSLQSSKVEVNPYPVPERETMDCVGSDTQPFGVRNDRIVLGPLTGDPSRGSIGEASTRTLVTPLPSSASSLDLPDVPFPASPTPTDDVDLGFSPTERKLLLARLAISAGLARACKLSVFESQLDTFLSKVEHVPDLLKAANDAPLNKREIIMRYGELLELRQSLSLGEENLVDSPELFWEESTEERALPY